MIDQGTKSKVARTLKWNTIDKALSQALYAVTGVILANVLPREAFGLVAAAMVFQAFAALFVDSGFSNALVQKKNPTSVDYSTVFWFNLGMAVLLYAALFAGAPLIADWFDGDRRLIPISRVIFISFILNALAIVQTNKLIKRMDVRMVAISNSAGLVASAAVGISMALTGWGAWSIVWQTITLAAVKTGILWGTSAWRPEPIFSFAALKSIFKVGAGVMGASTLNVIFQNIFSAVIGRWNGMLSLAYYSQAEKWSKMGVASMSNIFNTTFLPVLSQYQDSPREFAAATSKMNRLEAYILFPCMLFLAVMAEPLFHALFREKWDEAVPLFQLLLIRGIFVVLASQYSNFILARGRAKLLIVTEALRDGLSLLAIFLCLPWLSLGAQEGLTTGLKIFLWWQLAATAVAWAATLALTAPLSWRTPWQFIADLVPYAALSAAACAPMILMPRLISSPWLLLAAESLCGAAVYICANAALGSKIQADAWQHVRQTLMKKSTKTKNIEEKQKN
ncbi:MAG: lipopolysaccharide biosynthesis protein [Clostridium sp.]|nr:lipopolysaccharide biosynthesis protein [Clostridium sp.]